MKKKNVTKWAAGALLATSFLAVSISSIASAKEEFVIRDGVPIKYDGNEEFVIRDGILIKYNGNSGNVVIPDGVTSISEEAFKETDITGVEIPEGVQVIGEHAFAFCDNLETVEFPSTLVAIEYGAFFDDENLTQISIPEGVQTICESVFASCDNLQKVELPESLLSIGYECFDRCESLEEISIPDRVTALSDRVFHECVNLKKVDLPESIYLFPGQMFSDCENIEEIVIPNGPRAMGRPYMDECYKLKSITIPPSITYFEPGAPYFSGEVTIHGAAGSAAEQYAEEYDLPFVADYTEPSAEYLPIEENKDIHMKYSDMMDAYTGSDAEVIVPGSAFNILEGSFKNSNCETVVLPDGMWSLKDQVFEDSVNLETVVVGKGVTRMQYSAFSGCNNLKAIVIPPNVGSITFAAYDMNPVIYGEKGSYAEWFCKQHDLTFSTDIPDDIQELITRSRCEITDDSTLTAYSGTERNVILPDNIKTVGEAGFYGNKKVVSVKLQDGLENIDAFAFKDCTQLQTIEIPDSVQNIDSSAFDGCDNLTIYGSENSKAEEAAEKLDIPFDTGEPELGEDQDTPERKKKKSDNAAKGVNNTGKIQIGVGISLTIIIGAVIVVLVFLKLRNMRK